MSSVYHCLLQTDSHISSHDFSPVCQFRVCTNSAHEGMSPKSFQTSQSTFPFEVFLQIFPPVAFAFLYFSVSPDSKGGDYFRCCRLVTCCAGHAVHNNRTAFTLKG